jgi:hypothetical protein
MLEWRSVRWDDRRRRSGESGILLREQPQAGRPSRPARGRTRVLAKRRDRHRTACNCTSGALEHRERRSADENASGEVL